MVFAECAPTRLARSPQFAMRYPRFVKRENFTVAEQDQVKRLKVMTVVGTRPEIIKLSRVIAELDRYTDHILVHSGQNFDFELNEVFFQELGIRRPNIFL